MGSRTNPCRPALKHDPAAAFFLAVTASGLGLLAVVLAVGLQLEACHLYIFQRLVYFLGGASFLAAVLLWNHALPRILALVSGACSLWGICIAAQQSWLQWFPKSGVTWGTIEPSLTERLIDWLGELSPTFFMANGFCGSKDLEILGLSLANCSFLILTGFLTASACLAFGGENRPGPTTMDEERKNTRPPT
ncbi:disulfide bond formation protein B [Propionivibrio sp.]|uniref:disulfide bond formation protein B n=1 Tax=Propionivibrio sp. TaxID=2212460 RepID=UPI00272EADAE|nr:disulfide bond formation protein B [Propionivibrio sp.]